MTEEELTTEQYCIALKQSVLTLRAILVSLLLSGDYPDGDPERVAA